MLLKTIRNTAMDKQLPKPFMFTLSLIQGILLTLIYRSVDSQS